MMEDECTSTLLPEDDQILTSNPFLYSSFQSTRSKVLKIYAPQAHETQLRGLFDENRCQPRSLWTSSSEPTGSESVLWAIFDRHEQAVATLKSLPSSVVQPALESDIRPFTKLRKVDMNILINQISPIRHDLSPKVDILHGNQATSFITDLRPSFRTTTTSRHSPSPIKFSREGHQHPEAARAPKRHNENSSSSKNNTSLATPQSEMNTPIPAPIKPSHVARNSSSSSMDTPVPASLTPTAPLPTLFTTLETKTLHNEKKANISPNVHEGYAGGGAQKNGATIPSDDDGHNDEDVPQTSFNYNSAPFSFATSAVVMDAESLRLKGSALNLSGGVRHEEGFNRPTVWNEDQDEEWRRPLCGNAYLGTRDGEMEKQVEPTIHSITTSGSNNTSISLSLSLSSTNLTTSTLSSPATTPSPVTSVLSHSGDQNPFSHQDHFVHKPQSPSDEEQQSRTSNLGFTLDNRSGGMDHVNSSESVKVVEHEDYTSRPYERLSASTSLRMSSSSSRPSLAGNSSSPSKPSGPSSFIHSRSANLGMGVIGDAKTAPSSPHPPNLLSKSQSLPFLSQTQEQDAQYFLPTPPTTSTIPTLPTTAASNTSIFVPTSNLVPSVPPATFRHGDWICPLQHCGAHNFGRNVVCIICGTAKNSGLNSGGLGLGYGYGPNSHYLGNGNSSYLLENNNSASLGIIGNANGHRVGCNNVGFGFGTAGGLNSLASDLDPSLSLAATSTATVPAATAASVGSPAPFASASSAGENGGMAMGSASSSLTTNVGGGTVSGNGSMAMGMGMGVGPVSSGGIGSSAFGGFNGNFATGSNSTISVSGPGQRRSPTTSSDMGLTQTQVMSSTHIPVIPRLGLNGVGGNATNTTGGNGRMLMNTESVQALGGIHEVAAIQQAIKAHQSQKDSRLDKSRLTGIAQRSSSNSYNTTFSPLGPTGQLLIPTTLGNSPPTPLTHGPVVINSNAPQSQSQDALSLSRRSGHAHQNGVRPSGVQNPAAANFGPSSMVNMNGFFNNSPPVMFPHGQQQLAMNSINPALGNALPSTLGSHSQSFNSSSNNSNQSNKVHSLLTPSGRTFAVGGRVQNISRDELNPIFMYWPDNEPYPSTTQIRPPTAVLLALGGVHGPPPPILNTGNKGPIDAQPGDWTCGKCDYLNWRRRRVCANCYPHAEGNTEGTKHSTADVQERVALLASVLLQQQQQIQAQQFQQRHIQSPPSATELVSSAQMNGGIHGSNGAAYGEMVPRNGNAKVDPFHALASKYGYAVPPSAFGSMQSMQQPQQSFTSFHPHTLPSQPLGGNFNPNLPPRLAQGPGSYGDFSSNQSSLDPMNREIPSFMPMQNRAGDTGMNYLGNREMGGVEVFNGSGRQRSSGPRRVSPPSSRSSFSLGNVSTEASSYLHNGNVVKSSADEPTPSPLPLLPAFLQEVVGDASESSSSRSSIHESPSPPSSTSTTSSAYVNVRYTGTRDLSERMPTSGRTVHLSQLGQYSRNGLHRNSSQSSIWSLGFDYGHAGDIEDYDTRV